jgi:hypothetical protein
MAEPASVHRIVLMVVDPHGWASDVSLADALASLIEDNIEKLRRADAYERHLFVWLDWSSQVSQSAVFHLLKFGEIPDEIPEFPEGLDTIWVMAPAVYGTEDRPLFRVTTSGWELLDDGDPRHGP